MPLVRLTMLEHRLPDQRRLIAEAVHRSLVAVAGVPSGERFQLIETLSPAELRFDRTFGNAERQSVVLIEITVVRRLSVDQKRQLHRAIAGELVDIGVRADDAFIVLHETDLADWSQSGGRLTLVDP